MPEMKNLSIEQVNGGLIITTQMNGLRDDGSTAYTRTDRYIPDTAERVVEIVTGFYNLGRFEPYKEEASLSQQEGTSE